MLRVTSTMGPVFGSESSEHSDHPKEALIPVAAFARWLDTTATHTLIVTGTLMLWNARGDLELVFHVSLPKTEAAAKTHIWANPRLEPQTPSEEKEAILPHRSVPQTTFTPGPLISLRGWSSRSSFL